MGQISANNDEICVKSWILVKQKKSGPGPGPGPAGQKINHSSKVLFGRFTCTCEVYPAPAGFGLRLRDLPRTFSLEKVRNLYKFVNFSHIFFKNYKCMCTLPKLFDIKHTKS